MCAIDWICLPKQKLKQSRESPFDIFWILICTNKRQRVIQQKKNRETKSGGGLCGPIAKHNRSLSHHACSPSWCQFSDPLFMKSWQIGNWLSYDPTQPSGSLVPLYPFIYINKTLYLHLITIIIKFHILKIIIIK